MTAIDLSRLPPPEVIEQVNYEQILAEMVAELHQLDPELTLIESDPAYKVLQVAAYREMITTQRDNEKIRSLMAAYAKGSELDHIGVTYYSTPRLQIQAPDPEAEPPIPEVMESDEDYLRRFLLAPDGWSTAGPRDGYIYHALSADPEVLDVSAGTPAPTEVVITVLSRSGNGAASSELLSKVLTAVNDETVRPQTDLVTTQSAEIVEFTVHASIEVGQGPDPELVRAEAESKLSNFLAQQQRIGNSIVRDALLATLYVQGVHRVTMSPSSDIECAPYQAAYCTDLQVVLT